MIISRLNSQCGSHISMDCKPRNIEFVVRVIYVDFSILFTLNQVAFNGIIYSCIDFNPHPLNAVVLSNKKRTWITALYSRPVISLQKLYEQLQHCPP